MGGKGGTATFVGLALTVSAHGVHARDLPEPSPTAASPVAATVEGPAHIARTGRYRRLSKPAAVHPLQLEASWRDEGFDGQLSRRDSARWNGAPARIAGGEVFDEKSAAYAQTEGYKERRMGLAWGGGQIETSLGLVERRIEPLPDRPAKTRFLGLGVSFRR